MNKNNIYLKSSSFWLTDNLHSNEIKCKCSYEECTFFLFDYSLGRHFEMLRAALGSIPLNINSAYRCPMYNHDVGGASTSRHCSGRALDVARPKEIPFLEFYKIAQAIFPFTLTYEHLNFIHCDLDFRN